MKKIVVINSLRINNVYSIIIYHYIFSQDIVVIYIQDPAYPKIYDKPSI